MDPLLMDTTSDRRVFVRGLGTVGMGLLLGTFGGCEQCVESIQNRPTRRRLRTGSTEVDEDIECYRDAVALMKALPATDPRSWDAQAALHGTKNVSFNFCKHGSDHFFSWHRAYLRFFELICQNLTGNEDFGLPYWNWNQNPDIHADFLDTASVLYLARNSTSMASSTAVDDATLDDIFVDTNFFTFSSQLEGTPHNLTHTTIGGDFGGFGSAQDPIFWMHHCMVDYCWAKWNLELENDNTNDTAWNEEEWTHFVDGDGDPATTTAGITTLMPLLSYQYESSAIGSNAAALRARSIDELRILETRVREGADVRFEISERFRIADATEVSLAQPRSLETRVLPQGLTRLLEDESAEELIFASVGYAELPSRNDFFVRLFVNLPQASPQTSTEDPHYAGSFAFFGTRSPSASATGEHHHKTEFLVNVTNTLRRLRRAGQLRDAEPLSIQLVTVPMADAFDEGEVLRLDNLELIVTPVITPVARR